MNTKVFILSILMVIYLNSCNTNEYEKEKIDTSVGNPCPTGNGDIWILKLDENGNIQWQKCFNRILYESPISILRTKSGNFIFAGTSFLSDLWLLNLDSLGNTVWQKTIGNEFMGMAASSIKQTNDNGFIIAGSGGRGVLVMKFDENADIQWQKSYGGSYTEYALEIEQTKDGAYMVLGDSNSNDEDVSGAHGASDYWLLKINESGNILWQKCLGGSWDDFASSMKSTTDGGYIITGNTTSNDGDVIGNNGGASDIWTIKLDATGNIQWQKCLGGSKSDRSTEIGQCNDGGYYQIGFTDSPDGDVIGLKGGTDYWVVKLDDSGNIQWQKCLGGSSSDEGWSIDKTFDNGYIICGMACSIDDDVSEHVGSADYWILKLDESGAVQWQKSYGGTYSDEKAISIQSTPDKGCIVVGYSRY